MELPELPEPDESGYPSKDDPDERTSYSADAMREYARQAVLHLVDEMDAAVKNGDLPIECEDAVDWLAAAIRGEGRSSDET